MMENYYRLLAMCGFFDGGSGGGSSGSAADFKALIDRSITEIIVPEGTETIGSYALAYCQKATKIVLPDSLITIASSAFYYCSAIKELTIPARVDTIGVNAFRNCLELTTVTFKGTPSSIAVDAFTNDSRLTDIYVPWAEGEVANAPWGATKATIHYEFDMVMANLLPFPYLNDDRTNNGVTYVVQSDGGITASGVATGGSSFYIVNRSPIPTEKFTVSIQGEFVNLMALLILHDESGAEIDRATMKTDTRSFTVDIAKYPTATAITLYLQRELNAEVGGTIYPMINVGSVSLPFVKGTVGNGYTRKAYIEATGTQEINTDIPFVTGTHEYDIQFVDTGYRQLMGYTTNGTQYWGVSAAGAYEMGTNILIPIESANPFERNTVSWSIEVDGSSANGTLTVGGASITRSATDINAAGRNATLIIFSLTSITAQTYTSEAKLWGYKHKDADGNVDHDCVPAKRDSNGVDGLYDIITGTFYPLVEVA